MQGGRHSSARKLLSSRHVGVPLKMRTARGQQLEWGLDLGQIFVSCHCLCTLEVTLVILSPACLRTTVTCHLIVLPFALLLHPPVRDNPPLYLPCLTGLPLTPCA